jgi:hypothetical protein
LAHVKAPVAIWALYSLLQEDVGEPDIDPTDSAEVERVVRMQGVEVVRCRTGSQPPEYDTIPDPGWYERQAPPSWPVEADDDGRGEVGARNPASTSMHAQ